MIRQDGEPGAAAAAVRRRRASWGQRCSPPTLPTQRPGAQHHPGKPGMGFTLGLLQQREKREQGLASTSPSATSSPEESGSFGCLFKSRLKFTQISQCPFKTKTNSFQKIV